MNTPIKINKITCEIFKTLAPLITKTLTELGIENTHVHTRRALALREKNSFRFLPATTELDEDASEVFEFYTPIDQTKNVLNELIQKANLGEPGRGSIYAEEVDVINPANHNFHSTSIKQAKASTDATILTKLAGISCIVQRGQGNEIARFALETGTNVPTISYGIGTGLRNKLGLLRITIPAEKEIITIIISDHDKEEIMNSLIDVGRLDKPGRGFISTFPVGMGIINSKIFRGKQKQAATMEQIISAIDTLQENTEWRKRTANTDGASIYLRKYLSNLVNMTLICNEGKGMDLANEAMAAGSGGATISKVKFVSLTDKKAPVSPAREAVSMGISPASVQNIITALEKAKAFEEETSCIIETKPLPKACTYLGK